MKSKEAKDEEENQEETEKSDAEDPLKEIRNCDRKDRISQRKEEEKYFDLLLSGTSATLVIQTPKKLYIGWVGDS